VTQFLGFKPDADEWKVMALASYAEAENEYLEPMRRLVRVDERGRFAVALEYFEFYNFWDGRMYSDLFASTFGPPRASEEPLTARHERLAAALQRVFEEVMTASLVRLHERTGLAHLVASGGCFMNSVFNGKITRLTPFEQCAISSCPDDSGTSVGAALYLHGVRTGKRSLDPPTHNYWGPHYTDDECQAVARRFKLSSARAVPDPARAAAEDLVAGRLIGWFQGAMEFGQRALGHRSILADPRHATVKDEVNAAVKYRESFRPFAPAILAEHVTDWFDADPGVPVRFMERVWMFRPEKCSAVPGVVHVDGSGRLQTVAGDASPRFRELLRHFHRLTGIPLVLNTSFNLNGEPIVCSPEDAIRTFHACGLDVLYLGNVRLTK
jgi:carbamoyltransferase